MTTVAAALADARASLRAAGIETASLDARVLLEAVTGWTTAQVIACDDAVLDADADARFAALVRGRCARIPVSRLLGRREFWGLDFEVAPGTLDPRPDTETLVDAVTARMPAGMHGTLVDLGTGSGCILIALLSALPNMRGLGIDISAQALAVARRNAARLGVGERAALRLTDWRGAAVDALPRADVLVSNPPYIPSGALGGLMPEVRRHDPLRALDGGADGLSCYRAITRRLARLAKPGALVALEVGAGQAGAVLGLLAKAGCAVRGAGLGSVRDLSGIERVVVARAPRLASPYLDCEKGLGLRGMSR